MDYYALRPKSEWAADASLVQLASARQTRVAQSGSTENGTPLVRLGSRTQAQGQLGRYRPKGKEGDSPLPSPSVSTPVDPAAHFSTMHQTLGCHSAVVSYDGAHPNDSALIRSLRRAYEVKRDGTPNSRTSAYQRQLKGSRNFAGGPPARPRLANNSIFQRSKYYPEWENHDRVRQRGELSGSEDQYGPAAAVRMKVVAAQMYRPVSVIPAFRYNSRVVEHPATTPPARQQASEQSARVSFVNRPVRPMAGLDTRTRFTSSAHDFRQRVAAARRQAADQQQSSNRASPSLTGTATTAAPVPVQEPPSFPSNDSGVCDDKLDSGMRSPDQHGRPSDGVAHGEDHSIQKVEAMSGVAEGRGTAGQRSSTALGSGEDAVSHTSPSPQADSFGFDVPSGGYGRSAGAASPLKGRPSSSSRAGASTPDGARKFSAESIPRPHSVAGYRCPSTPVSMMATTAAARSATGRGVRSTKTSCRPNTPLDNTFGNISRHSSPAVVLERRILTPSPPPEPWAAENGSRAPSSHRRTASSHAVAQPDLTRLRSASPFSRQGHATIATQQRPPNDVHLSDNNDGNIGLSDLTAEIKVLAKSMSDLAEMAASTVFGGGRPAPTASTELVRERVSSVNAMGQQLRHKLSSMDLTTAQPVLEALKKGAPGGSGATSNA